MRILDEQEQRFDWWIEHTYINVICWGILIDIPIVVARYNKINRFYLIFHGIFMTIIICASLLAEFAMSYTSWSNYSIDEFDE